MQSAPAFGGATARSCRAHAPARRLAILEVARDISHMPSDPATPVRAPWGDYNNMMCEGHSAGSVSDGFRFARCRRFMSLDVCGAINPIVGDGQPSRLSLHGFHFARCRRFMSLDVCGAINPIVGDGQPSRLSLHGFHFARCRRFMSLDVCGAINPIVGDEQPSRLSLP